MNRLLINIKFWVWAATHSRWFDGFQIGFTRFIKIQFHYSEFSYEVLLVSTSLHKPKFIYCVKYTDAKNYANAMNIHEQDLYGFDDIPF